MLSRVPSEPISLVKIFDKMIEEKKDEYTTYKSLDN